MKESDNKKRTHPLLSNLLALLFGLFLCLLIFLFADIVLGILKNRQAREVIDAGISEHRNLQNV